MNLPQKTQDAVLNVKIIEIIAGKIKWIFASEYV